MPRLGPVAVPVHQWVGGPGTPPHRPPGPAPCPPPARGPPGTLDPQSTAVVSGLPPERWGPTPDHSPVWAQAVALKRAVPARSAEPVLFLLPAWAGFVGPRATALGAPRARTVVARHHEARLITAVCAIPCLTGAEARENRRGASRMKVAAGPARDPLVIVVRRGFPSPSIVLLPSTRSPARVCQRHPPPVDGARSR